MPTFQFSIWVRGTELRSSGLLGKRFTGWASPSAFPWVIPQIIFSIPLVPGMMPGAGAIRVNGINAILAFLGLSVIHSSHPTFTRKVSWLHVASLLMRHKDLHQRCCWGSTSCIIFSGCLWVISEIKWLAKWRNEGKCPGINQHGKEGAMSYVHLGSILLQLTQGGSRLQSSLLAEGWGTRQTASMPHNIRGFSGSCLLYLLVKWMEFPHGLLSSGSQTSRASLCSNWDKAELI